MSHPGSQFLHERDPNLHASREVEDVVAYLNQGVRDQRRRDPEADAQTIPNEPADKIAAYLGFLADRDRVNDGILTGDQTSIDRQIEARVIKTEDVPESYFELQRRIAREQGHGDVQITPEIRGQLIEAAQADQRAGLGKWVEYLSGEDGGYQDWFKHYVFESLGKLGSYDKEKGEFTRRSKGTAAPYPELNREALAYVYDALNKSRIRKEADGPAADEELQKLLKGANFGKLYAHAVLKTMPASPELRKQIKGSWKKFDQTDDPRVARRLAESIQPYGTGWCTAGESTAHAQLSAGDFYVYYTRNEDGKDTVPRVAIRMQGGEVVEVRGVNPAQELEPDMADITSNRLQDLPGGEAYIQKADDMERLTAIEKLTAAHSDAELSQADLRFLYELDHEIQGFGYERDPRINEIRALRGERDKPELARLLPETIRDQLKSAFTGYANVAERLGLGGRQRRFRGRGENVLPAAEVSRLFEQKDREWRANGIYEYLVEQLITAGARYNLVATPNVAASEEQIVALAENFGKDQPFGTYVYDELYRRGRYSAGEWSGNKGAEGVRFSLIPSAYDQELGFKPAQQQLEMLRERQAKQPRFNFRVPSVLDAVTYWYTLRAGTKQLAGAGMFEKTYIRHFDMELKQVGGWRHVPRSLVYGDGLPYLDRGGAESGGGARVAVG